ncbi:hypothetical protein, partial [Flavobacterium sp.]|uniref:hypothetical protein n=1 Tax=Flavobacterium sp. TaxID=239 RepID=UPI0037C0B447
VAQRIDSPLMAGVCRCPHGAAFFCSRRSSSARRSKSAAISANKRVKNALSAAAAFSLEVLSMNQLSQGPNRGFKRGQGEFSL